MTMEEVHGGEGDDALLGSVKASSTLAFFWLCRTTAFFLILRCMHGVVCGAPRQGPHEQRSIDDRQ